MSVWLCIPSKRTPEEVNPILAKWRDLGYRTALLRDVVDVPKVSSDLCYFSKPLFGGYPGYARACNFLIGQVMREDPDADWFVTGGDDIEPDPNHTAEEIAQQCSMHFAKIHAGAALRGLSERTFGVMQPTGDRWGEDANGSAYIDRVAGSPWIGREFARRMYRGKGPYWPEYTHQFVDEELQSVAMRYGVFWQRRDLMHLHRHWGRTEPSRPGPTPDMMPAFLREANSSEHWSKYRELFQQRKAAGFPESEPIV